MNGKIYKITNTITNESYIGKTIQTIEERFNEHKRGTLNNEKDKTKFHKAMAEYGHRNFEIELIEENITCPVMLGLKETMAILEYGTLQEYNSILGRRSVPAGYGTEEWDYEKYKLKKAEDKQRTINNKSSSKFSVKKRSTSMKKPLLCHSDILELFKVIDKPHEFNILTTLLYKMKDSDDSLTVLYEDFLDEMNCPNGFDITRLKNYTQILNDSLYSLGVFSHLELNKETRMIEAELNEDYLYLIESEESLIALDLDILRQYRKSHSKRIYSLITNACHEELLLADFNQKIKVPVSYNTSSVMGEIIEPFIEESTLINNPYEVEKIKRGRKIHSLKFTPVYKK